MTEYKANSHRAKENEANEERKKVEPVVQGVKKKSNVGRKFSDVFVSEDIHNVKSYILMDVLVPAIKKAVSDVITNGIDMLLYGEKGRTSSKSSNQTYVSYNRYSDRDYRDSDRRDRGVRSSYAYDDFVFRTRSEAEQVLNSMDDILDRYKVVTVMDMYELCNERCDYTASSYGWTNLRSAEVVRVKDGYVIKMPRALPLN